MWSEHTIAVRTMGTFFQDIRYAFRVLRKSPGFTAVAVLTLALGIGANSAIFTLVNALLLKMLPVKNPQELVVVGDPAFANSRSNGTPRTDVFSYPLYTELRDQNSVFSGLCAAATDHRVDVRLSKEDGGLKVSGRMVSGNYFRVLGLEPAAGRLIADSDDTAENANPVVVLGQAFWRSKFSSDPSVIGKEIRLNGNPFTVVGVAPAGFDGDVVGEQMSLFVPLSMQSEIVRGRHWLKSANSSWLSLIGRLNTGTTVEQAEANVNVVFQQGLKGDYGALITSDDKNAIHDAHLRVQAGGNGVSSLRGNYRIPLLVLMSIVGLILLMACVNVANLLLSRAALRSREIAVRLAIGAARIRVLRQLLTESVLLALLGGAAGSVLAFWGVRILVKMFGSGAVIPLSPDIRVLAFTFGISLFTGIVFGLAPALRTLRVSVAPVLKSAGHGVSEPRYRFSWGKGLIAGQVAVSLLVVFAATLLVRSLQKVMTQDFGYRREHLLVARLDPTGAGYSNDKMKLFAEQLSARLSAVPGVRAVTYSTNGLFANTESADAILVPGFQPSSPRDRGAREDYVGPDYFKVVGIPILAGRGIEAQDTAASLRVATVNEAMAKRFFPGLNPIGRQFRIDDPAWLDKPITIVGISRNAKDHGSGLRDDVPPRFYLAYQQIPEPIQIVIEAQASGEPSAVVATLRSQIKAADPSIPVSFVETLDELVDGSAADQIALARLSGFFAGLALLLGCVGLYGVMSSTVAMRTREIGVRMAMGARRGDMVVLVLREGLILVGVGIAVGIPVALASGRVLRNFLFELSSADPVSLTIVVFALALVAVIAGFVPARRAARVEPMVALRYE